MARKQNWLAIAKLLRKRGWNYHYIEWLIEGVDGINWRVTVRRYSSPRETPYEEVSAERKTLLACYVAVLAETEKARIA